MIPSSSPTIVTVAEIRSHLDKIKEASANATATAYLSLNIIIEFNTAWIERPFCSSFAIEHIIDKVLLYSPTSAIRYDLNIMDQVYASTTLAICNALIHATKNAIPYLSRDSPLSEEVYKMIARNPPNHGSILVAVDLLNQLFTKVGHVTASTLDDGYHPIFVLKALLSGLPFSPRLSPFLSPIFSFKSINSLELM